jgi:hypothetical protein
LVIPTVSATAPIICDFVNDFDMGAKNCRQKPILQLKTLIL